MHSLLVALAFLTVMPIRFGQLPSPQLVARSRFWFPVVGLLLGGLLGGWMALLIRWLPARGSLTAFLTLFTWLGLTGALHLDGLCDVCDGLFGGRTPEDRLRIMKDPRRGTFGVAGAVLLLLGKFVVLQELILAHPAEAPWFVAGALVVARSLVLCMAAGARYPRPDGTGKAFIEATRGWELALFAVAAAVAAVAAVGFGVLAGLQLFAPALLAVMALRWLCERRLGGVTGDCLGAGIEIAEWVFLAGAVLFLRE